MEWGWQQPKVLLAGLSWHRTTVSWAKARTSTLSVLNPRKSPHFTSGGREGSSQLLTALAENLVSVLVSWDEKDLTSCSLQEESPLLARGRGGLYSWLSSLEWDLPCWACWREQTSSRHHGLSPFLPNFCRFSRVEVSSFVVYLFRDFKCFVSIFVLIIFTTFTGEQVFMPSC